MEPMTIISHCSLATGLMLEDCWTANICSSLGPGNVSPFKEASLLIFSLVLYLFHPVSSLGWSIRIAPLCCGLPQRAKCRQFGPNIRKGTCSECQQDRHRQVWPKGMFPFCMALWLETFIKSLNKVLYRSPYRQPDQVKLGLLYYLYFCTLSVLS